MFTGLEGRLPFNVVMSYLVGGQLFRKKTAVTVGPTVLTTISGIRRSIDVVTNLSQRGSTMLVL